MGADMFRYLLAVALVGCASTAREVVLAERVNAEIEQVPVGLGAVETKSLWRNGKRVKVDQAVLLVRDPGAPAIRQEKVWVGDQVTIGAGVWEVVELHPGSTTAAAKIRLRRVGDR
jgi:hypothetical protein